MKPMNRDVKVIYTSSVAIVAALLLALFLPGNSVRAVTALLLAASAVVVFRLIKKRAILSINKREVLGLMAVIGVLYIVLYYLSGIKFGFYKSLTPLSVTNFFKYILPISIIIIAVEIIRSILLMQNRGFVAVLAYVAGVLSEMLVFSSLSYIVTFSRFMDAVGLTLLPAVTANLLYNYISKKYGAYPNIVYRLIITLYTYIIPVYPQTPDSLFAFAKLFVPLAVWFFIKTLYEKKSYFEKRESKIASRIISAVLVLFMISTVMLISCQFRFGALVIATESMTGELNKGDAIVYEEYDEQLIKEQDIVVFNANGKRVVHRVVEIQCINGRNRYFTKGDANDDWDSGYITDDRIEGVVLFKVAYIGYPSIWLRNIFK